MVEADVGPHDIRRFGIAFGRGAGKPALAALAPVLAEAAIGRFLAWHSALLAAPLARSETESGTLLPSMHYLS